MTARCREGHDSSESDYCSVCGAPIAPGAPMAPAGAAVSPGSDRACPSCGEPRADMDARFCEVCRYDFVSRKGGPPPQVASPVAPPVTAPPVVAPAAGRVWELVVRIDPTLDTDPDPASPCPKDAPETVLTVDAAEMLVGRRDDRRDIRPEIPVNDPGASRRHAKFVKNPDGTVSIQDLASMNGTQLNAADMVPGSRVVLKDGDSVTLGRWTRILLRGHS